MKSIGARITVFYAITTTAILACLFVAGHYLLESYLIHQLDEINEAQFKHLKATLGPDYRTLTPSTVDDRIREATESASSLFYVDMHGPMTNRFFKSHNLQGHSIPDLVGQHTYSIDVDRIGELRVSEFLLPPFEVMVGTPLAPVYDLLAGYRKVFFGLLAAMLVASIVIGYVLSKLILRPVRVIQATANRIRSDNLNERIPVAEVKDEISQLARLLNQMFDRLETSFDEIRRFSADASHELKTPLSLVRLHAERLMINSDLDASQKESVQVQLEELARVGQIIDELLFLSRADARAITIDLVEQRPEAFLHGFEQDARVLAEHHGVKFVCDHRGEGTVAVDNKRIRQVLLNLLVNALNVSPPGGVINLESLLSDGVWRLSLVDDGPGLTPEQCEQIFERFVRLNPAGKDPHGSGLGLAISRSIVKLHKGDIRATSSDVGRGLRIVIELPAGNAIAWPAATI
ncbi:ATP-binding protein [Polaromonas jejuensis]|uniref:histidine kinase n=1 Tax=Polaromonas jejuensis TaxID=457502 RepID=A0ABW0Q7D7_9BURK|nr:ATP-binding protein [Polaromonas jejuensis]